MSRLPEVSSGYNEPHRCYPFLSCLDLDSLARLEAAIYYNHRRHIVMPTPEMDIMDFNAAREMSRTPGSENHMRAT